MRLHLGNGWYRGRLGFHGNRNLYGDELGGFAQLEVEFEDGHRQVVGTDSTWQAGASRTTANDLYDGQTIDARRGATDQPWDVGVHDAAVRHRATGAERGAADPSPGDAPAGAGVDGTERCRCCSTSARTWSAG